MTNTEKKTGSTQAQHKKSKSFEERLHALNDRQREAVETIDGPLLVVAGPGSGKTELLSLRVGNILRKTGVAPHNILCLTFTENGALAMRERLATLIGADAYRTAIFTFHAFCNHVISRFPEYFFQSAHFTQATDVKRAELLETIFKSLPYGHPMGSYHPEKGYVYLHDVKDRIKHIKSYGYTSDEYQEVVSLMVREYAPITEALSVWPGRVQVKDLGDIKGIIETFKKLKSTTSIYLAKSLEEAVALAELLGKAEPLSSWKAKYTVKDEGVLMLKDEYNKEKILAVAELYTKYSKAMYEEGLYDYDDMIIEVAHALREEESLRTVLEEQYQYILVDEFQDTNEAQMSLIEAITRNEIHEGSPNVCVVGDDDQAIYKFQGAEVSHMMRFREHLYRNVKTVVLDSNYRSTQGILDASRQVITQIVGGGRLENAYQDISKVLTSKNIHLPKGAVTFVHTLSDVSEYTLVADRIREALDQGVNPDEVAVLARSHRELRALLPYLDRKEIPYEYEKKANVFDEPHVKILIEVCDYLSSPK
jgi:DNA helicase-2/ATP-dependent DNA helicase PcrA